MSWVAESCTLPAGEQTVRVAEFDALFGGGSAVVERLAPATVRFVLDPAVEAAARELAAREAECCAFFTFGFGYDAAGRLLMDVAVRDAHTAVLDALAERAARASA